MNEQALAAIRESVGPCRYAGDWDRCPVGDPCPYCAIRFLIERLDATRARSEARRVMLERFQWSGADLVTGKAQCPNCGEREHMRSCELAQLIQPDGPA